MVHLDGEVVPHERVSDKELKVTIDASKIAEPGRHDIVVMNPEPLAPGAMGTSNKAHLLVDYSDSTFAADN